MIPFLKVSIKKAFFFKYPFGKEAMIVTLQLVRMVCAVVIFATRANKQDILFHMCKFYICKIQMNPHFHIPCIKEKRPLHIKNDFGLIQQDIYY